MVNLYPRTFAEHLTQWPSSYPQNCHPYYTTTVIVYTYYTITETNLIVRNTILYKDTPVPEKLKSYCILHLKRICRCFVPSKPFDGIREKKKKLSKKTHFEYKHFNLVPWQMYVFFFLSCKLYIILSNSTRDNRNWPINVHGNSVCVACRVGNTPGFSNDLYLMYVGTYIPTYSFLATQICTNKNFWCMMSV